jgi:transposase
VRGHDGFAAPLWPQPARDAPARDTPCSHCQTHTVVVALRLDGLDAPAIFDGSIDNPTFLAYCRASPRPTLRPGDVVVLDGLAPHKQPEVSAAVEQRGARLPFLPRYSPDFNPSELAFAKLKAFFRASRPRNLDQVVEPLASALKLCSPMQCRNCIRLCGYRVPTEYEKRSRRNRL